MIYIEQIIAKRLSVIGDSEIKETDLMDQVWDDMTAAINRGDMLDVPYRREREGICRIHSVVVTLREWIQRGIIDCMDSDGNSRIRFKVRSQGMISDTLSGYEKEPK